MKLIDSFNSSPFCDRILAGLFIASAMLIALETLLVRILCYALRMDYVHLVIALAMTGLGIAGTYLSILSSRNPSIDPRNIMGKWCIYFSISIPVSFFLFSLLSPSIESSTLSLIAIPLVLLFPFIAGGIVIVSALSLSTEKSIGTLYAADLTGAGLGCLLQFLLIREIGAEYLLVIIAAQMIIASVILLRRDIFNHKLIILMAIGICTLTSIPSINKKVFYFQGDIGSNANQVNNVPRQIIWDI